MCDCLYLEMNTLFETSTGNFKEATMYFVIKLSPCIDILLNVCNDV